ncbi:MAG: hypothetical protein J0L74_04525, partial [Burkholderiales bacterium]|nr:hypothetical protein [Burkholderiales bacterium]
EEQVAVAQRSLDAFAAGRDYARALVEAGNLPPVDASTQDAAYQEARITVAELELEALDRREEMHRMLGVHGDETRWTTRGALGPAPATLAVEENAETRALTASLEAGALRSQMEGAARRAGVARVAGLIPELTGDVHVLVGDPAQRSGFDSLGRNWTVGAGVGLALPLFDRQQGHPLAEARELQQIISELPRDNAFKAMDEIGGWLHADEPARRAIWQRVLQRRGLPSGA